MIKNINAGKAQEIYEKYLKVCKGAAENDGVFSTFKSHPDYTPVLEHCSKKLGQNHLDEIIRNNDKLLDNKKVYDNDKYGYAKLERYELPNSFPLPVPLLCSPTTLQYLNVVSNLIVHFNSLEGFRIIEIGGGYGGQCKIIQDVFNINHYAIIDLEIVSALQYKYLSKLNCEEKVFLYCPENYNGITEETDFNLFISNYALSEMPADVQMNYIKDVALNCKHGYITCNAPLNGADLLKDKFKNFTISPDIEGEREDNFIITW